MISEKILASMATIPFSRMVPSTMVSIPNSISFVVNLISLVDASIRIHSRMDIVVLEGTALREIFTLFKRLLLEQTRCIKGSFPVEVENSIYKYIIINP